MSLTWEFFYAQEKVLSMAKHASAELLKRAGIQIPNRMNFV